MLEMSKRINGFNRMAVVNAEVVNLTSVADGASFIRLDSHDKELRILENARASFSEKEIQRIAIECTKETSGLIQSFMSNVGYGCITKHQKGGRAVMYCIPEV